jgi:pimeloyl-ACP methyl ester carboxylesterase
MHGSGLHALGCGSSLGEAVDDFKKVYDFVKLRTKPDRIVLYGSKLASTVVLAAVQKYGLHCAGMVLSSPVLDPLNTAMHLSPFSKYAHALGPYPVCPLGAAFSAPVAPHSVHNAGDPVEDKLTYNALRELSPMHVFEQDAKRGCIIKYPPTLLSVPYLGNMPSWDSISFAYMVSESDHPQKDNFHLYVNQYSECSWLPAVVHEAFSSH